MLNPNSSPLRLFLHVLAATVWVGGQLTMVGLLATVRALSPEAPRAVARAFNRVAWPAFGLLVVTGVWNLLEVDISSTSTNRQVTILVHLTLAALSGISAAIHSGTRQRLVLALSGAAGGLLALITLFTGVLLRTA